MMQLMIYNFFRNLSRPLQRESRFDFGEVCFGFLKQIGRFTSL